MSINTKQGISVNHIGPHQIPNTSSFSKNATVIIKPNNTNSFIAKQTFSESIHQENGELCWTSFKTV